MSFLGQTFSDVAQVLGEPDEQGYDESVGPHYYMLYLNRSGTIRFCSPVTAEEPTVVSIVLGPGQQVLSVRVGMVFAEIKTVLGEPYSCCNTILVSRIWLRVRGIAMTGSEPQCKLIARLRRGCSALCASSHHSQPARGAQSGIWSFIIDDGGNGSRAAGTYRDAYDGPVGAANIFAILSDEMATSEATTGRRLRDLDRAGHTRKVGRRGRVLTDEGRKQLVFLRISFPKCETMAQLLRELETNTKDKLIEVLKARVLIEGPLANLAASRARRKQLVAAEEILAEEGESFIGRSSGAEQDSAFHKLVAEMSQNKVLGKALQLVKQQSELSPHLASIRQQVGHLAISDHRKILTAIRMGDGALAQAAMVSHLESIKCDVEMYWSTLRIASTEAQKQARP